MLCQRSLSVRSGKHQASVAKGKPMSDQTQSSNQQMIVIAMVVIAALLAAIVGVVVFQQMNAAKLPNPSTAAVGATGAAAPAAAPVTAATGPFDAKTATKVPAGMTPEQMVKAYHENIAAGKYDAAYKLLPLDKQQSYGNAKAYTDQVKAYGITGYEMGKPVATADKIEIAATQVTPQMPITYTWSFTKVGSQWYVASRAMGGTVTK